jgi:hypothetical protein
VELLNWYAAHFGESVTLLLFAFVTICVVLHHIREMIRPSPPPTPCICTCHQTNCVHCQIDDDDDEDEN